MVDVVTGQAWMVDAACAGHDLRMWFPEEYGHKYRRYGLAEVAVAICRTCPVRRQCLEYAMAWEQGFAWKYQGRLGIFGGLTPQQRNVLAKSRVRVS